MYSLEAYKGLDADTSDLSRDSTVALLDRE